MFQRLAPPSASNPWPVESRCSTSLVVASLLETISLPAGLSYQRKAGMSVLSPRRMPAWLAEVWEERSGSQPRSRWVPVVSQRWSVGM